MNMYKYMKNIKWRPSGEKDFSNRLNKCDSQVALLLGLSASANGLFACSVHLSARLKVRLETVQFRNRGGKADCEVAGGSRKD